MAVTLTHAFGVPAALRHVSWSRFGPCVRAGETSSAAISAVLEFATVT
jgi:hypothetical protein